MQWRKQLEGVFKVRGHDGHCGLPPRRHHAVSLLLSSPVLSRPSREEGKGRLIWCHIGSCCCVGRLAESCLSPSVQSGNHSTLSCLWRCQGSLTLYQMHSGWIFCSRCDLLLNSSLAGPSFCLAFQRGMQMN